MVTCHSVEEVRAAALADHARDGKPLTQAQADQVALILSQHQGKPAAA